MKKLLFILFVSNLAFTQTIWNGPTMTFTKADYANPYQEANQDHITPNVWLTRGADNVLFNVVSQTAAPSSGFNSPLDTEWAEGTTANFNQLTYTDFKTSAPLAGNGKRKVIQMVDKDYVLHLISDNIYIDIKITSWTSGQAGGGFSYQRSTDPSLSIQDNLKPVLSVYPNPSTSFLHVNGLNASTNYRLYNILGAEVRSGTVKADQGIDIDALQSGVYMLQISNTALPFVKK
jgi:hypothetical protein